MMLSFAYGTQRQQANTFFFKKKVSNGDSAYHTSIQVRDFPTRMTCAECKHTHCDYCRQLFPRAMNMLEFSALALVATHRLTNCCFFSRTQIEKNFLFLLLFFRKTRIDARCCRTLCTLAQFECLVP